MNELALFAGSGGGILGGLLLGWRTRCAVEINPYCRKVLLARQRDGILPRFPIWDDVRTFDGKPWRGSIDVISGGFPCQDISAAGKGRGIEGERSGLWKEFARIVDEVRPKHVFVENSPMLIHRGLGVVLGNLASMGFDARWGVLGAIHVGAPHKRERIWIVATHPDREPLREQPECEYGLSGEAVSANDGGKESMAHPDGSRKQQPEGNHQKSREWTRDSSKRKPLSNWWTTEPNVGRVADGVASRVDRLAALGNGQVPSVAALAWSMLSQAQK